jgi:hypothetical protein
VINQNGSGRLSEDEEEMFKSTNKKIETIYDDEKKKPSYRAPLKF